MAACSPTGGWCRPAQGARAALSRRKRAEPERVSEKLHQNTFWMGRGGTLTHTISGIDIALWDILGQGDRAAGRPSARRQPTAQRVQPYCSLLMEEPARMRDVVAEYRDKRLPRLQDRLGPVRPRAATQSSTRRSSAPRARRPARHRSCSSMPGQATRYWPHGLKWAMRTAEMLKDFDVGWFEEPLRARCASTISASCAGVSPVPIAGGEVLTRRQSFIPWLTRGAFDIVQPDVTKVGGISEQRRIAWMALRFRRQICRPRLEHRARRRRRPAAGGGLPRCRPGRVHRRQPLCGRHP